MARAIGAWCLNVHWNLEVGVWCFFLWSRSRPGGIAVFPRDANSFPYTRRVEIASVSLRHDQVALVEVPLVAKPDGEGEWIALFEQFAERRLIMLLE